MNVLHLTGDTEDSGGILSVLRALDGELSEVGVKQSVWVHEGFEETRQPALNLLRSKWVCGFHPNHARLVWSSFLAFFELHRILKKGSIDVIHAHSQGTLLVGLLANRILRRQMIYTNHAYSARKSLYRTASRLPGVVTVSLTPNMVSYYGFDGRNRNAVQIVSECSTRRFFELPLKQRPNRNGGPIKLIGLGTIMRWKKWHLILNALKLLDPAERKHFRFELFGGRSMVGDSPAYARELEEGIRMNRMEENMMLRGTTPDVVSKLEDADWFVLPSTNEPCSVALVEALAMGKPAIVSESGGNVDIVRAGKTGLFFRQDDERSLADAFRRLLAEPQPPCPAEAIRDSVHMRTPQVVAKQYLDLYREMTGSMSDRGGRR